jgi:hypothetical protein
MKLSADFIISLIENKNPVYIIGNKLLDIWLRNAKNYSNIKDFYYKGEEPAKRFEEFILGTYDEFYKLLARECVNVSSVFQRHNGISFIVMDGMSFREGVLISNMLKSKGYETRLSFSFSAIPSDTLPFREKTKVSMNDFKEIKDPQSIRLSGDEKYIWSRFPDVMLDKIQAGLTVISSLEKMYETSAKIAKEITDKLKTNKIVILSDHGYIRSEAGFIFTVPANIKANLQNIFGSNRHVSMNVADASDLVKEGYVEEFAGYYLVKSRYVWPVRGKYSIYLHGGLSLMECFTPVIEVNKQ